jgi:hypothetical protein
MPSYTALTPKRQESLRLAILVKQQSALIHRGTSGEERRFGGRFTLKEGDRIQRLQAEAAAQTYFAPPQTGRGVAAAPNLFQPFWRARLIDVAEAKKNSSTEPSLPSNFSSTRSMPPAIEASHATLQHSAKP